MEIFVLSFFAFALAGLGMALGVLFGRRPLAGSCGGLGCDYCGDECKRKDGPS